MSANLLPESQRLPAWTRESGRVAIVHDWITGMRGGEAILDGLCEIFPKADLLTLLQTDYRMSPRILEGRRVIHSPLQALMAVPGLARRYRQLLPLFPWAIRQLDLSGYDLVISNTHCVAKGVRVPANALHVSYVSTPMRYIWDLFDDYFGPDRAGPLTRIAARAVRKPLQRWDLATTPGVQYLAANSTFVAERIRRFWGRNDSVVVHPFVELERFQPLSAAVSAPENRFYLIVSAFAPYKRLDIAIEAFRRLRLPLRIVGKGQDEKKLKSLAAGADNIQFLGAVSNSEINDLYRRAEALVFPGLEDFGITPLESMASGRPVIAFGKGGVLDTITSDTGVLFPEQSAAALAEAVLHFESKRNHYSSAACRARAEEFSREHFLRRFTKLVGQGIREKQILS